MLNWYYLLLCSLFKWACLLSISHDFFHTLLPLTVGWYPCSYPRLTQRHVNALNGWASWNMWRGGVQGPFNFLFNVMQISSSSIWERWCLSRYPGTLAVAGCCCFRHMVSGRGSGKLTKPRSLKWLLALLTKIGELSADRGTSGICSNSYRALQFQTTKLSLNFYSIFWDQAMKKKYKQTEEVQKPQIPSGTFK